MTELVSPSALALLELVPPPRGLSPPIAVLFLLSVLEPLTEPLEPREPRSWSAGSGILGVPIGSALR